MTQATNQNAPLAIVRLLQAELACVIVALWAWSAFKTGADVPYDLTLALCLLTLAASGSGIVALQMRARAAIPLVLVATIGAATMLLVGSVQTAGLASATRLSLVAAFALTAGATLLSPGLKTCLSTTLLENPKDRQARLDAAIAAQAAGTGRAAKPWRHWDWWRNLIIHYCAFSIVGHWAEMLFCQLIRLGIVAGEFEPANRMLWEWWLYPFPAEGIAVVLIVVALHPLKEWLIDRMGGHKLPALVLSFFANAAVCTSIDFLTGITCNANYQLWDYSDLPFNFMGQICLQNSLVYSTAATLLVWALYPALERILHRPNSSVMNVAFAGLVASYMFLELLYFVYISASGVVFG